MMDVSKKQEEVMKMVEDGEYFVINRPRQYGKTTMLHLLDRIFEADSSYLSLRLTFEDVEEQFHLSEPSFAQMFFTKIQDELVYKDEMLHEEWSKSYSKELGFPTLSKAISSLIRSSKRKIVLLIDEVDVSSNYLVFLRFLALLRTKYLNRYLPGGETFYSIILAGVHDIKSLKYKMRNPGEAQYNSPWNIATNFEVEMSFDPSEIAPMLEDYAVAEGVNINIPEIADYLYYYTAGYPFLVSKLCKTVAEKLIPKKAHKDFQKTDIDEAVRLLLRENNTNFDSLIKNLDNNTELYDLTFSIIVEGSSVSFNPHNQLINKGILYGIFKRNGQVKIHNRIYEQIIYNYMISNIEVRAERNYGGHFIREDQSLNMEAILLKFQQFMQQEYSKKDTTFLERNGRLVFLAFLNPILNGQGHTFKEVEISEEKRLDVVVSYRELTYIIELKRWYGESYHQRGLKQLVSYLDKQQKDEGYLLIFEQKEEKTWRQEVIEQDGKRIFAVWV